MIGDKLPSCCEKICSSLGVEFEVTMQISSIFLDICACLVEGKCMSSKHFADFCRLYAQVFRSLIKWSIRSKQTNSTQEQQGTIIRLHPIDIQTLSDTMHNLGVCGDYN